jgi:hypothetical protein
MTDKKDTTNSASQAEQQSIVAIVEHSPALVMIEPKNRDALLAHVEKEVAEFVPDLTTAAGRDECRAFARKIVRTKTTLDNTAKQLTEEWRTKTAAVNAERKTLVERLADLAEQARRPLTEWEEAEDKRVDECSENIQAFTRAGVVAFDATSADVEARRADLDAHEIDPERYQGMTEAAIKAKANSLLLLDTALERIRQQEEQAAELAQLREQQAERDRQELERLEREREFRLNAEAEAEAARLAAEAEQEARERAEQEAEQSRLAEIAAAEAAQAAEREATERANQAAQAAAEAAQREAEAKALAEQEDRERAHKAQIEALEEQNRAEVERQQAELARIARENAQREAAKKAEAEARAKLEADQARRTRCKREAKEALQTFGVTEDVAKAIVIGIIAGEVPRVSIDFAAEPHGARAVFEEARHDADLDNEDAPLLKRASV